jgi:Ni/Co efflux regulator RcnB
LRAETFQRRKEEDGLKESVAMSQMNKRYVSLLMAQSQFLNVTTECDPDAGEDLRREEKGRTEDEMDGWHHQLHGHESERTSGDGEEQGDLACYSSWARRE